MNERAGRAATPGVWTRALCGSRVHFAAVCFVVLASAGVLWAGQAPPAGSLTLAGGDGILWIVKGQWDRDQQRSLYWIASMEPTNLAMRPLALSSRFGQVRRSAEWGGALHLFVTVEEEGRTASHHFSYERPGEERRQRRLPDEAVPAALAGGSAEMPGLWAVVDNQVAQQVRSEWEDYQRTQQTQPADNQEAAAPAAVPGGGLSVESRPGESRDEGAHLISYDGIRWRPEFAGPDGLAGSARVWLTVSGERLHLFWQAQPEGADIRYFRRENGTWLEMASVHFSGPVSAGFAGILNRQLVFSALVGDGSGSGVRCEPRVFMPGATAWNESPPLKQASGEVVTLPEGSVLGGLGDKLAVLRASAEGAEAGLWSLADGRLVLPFAEVPIRKDGGLETQPGLVQDVVYLVAVMGIILLVYWRRREGIASPVVLPQGLAPADFGRRGLAALIDMAPAGILVGLIWQAPLADYVSEWQLAIHAQEPPPSGRGLLWAWACFVLVYSGWCTAFELFLLTTPGKKLLGCSVLSESMQPPTRLQIVVRNALRILEWVPQLKVWPFLLVVVMTRNRQRVGDLLARTIVVERTGRAGTADGDSPPRSSDADRSKDE